MLFDKDEDHNHKNCTFNYFKLYIVCDKILYQHWQKVSKKIVSQKKTKK